MIPTIVCLARNHDVAKAIMKALAAEKFSDVILFVHPHAAQKIMPFEGLKQVVPEPAASMGGAAVAGGAVGALASTATLPIPFVGPFIFILTLPIATAFGAAAGAVAGAVKGEVDHTEVSNAKKSVMRDIRRLEDLGMPETEIPRYQSALAYGRYLIAIRSMDEKVLRRAETIFESNEGENVSFFNTASGL